MESDAGQLSKSEDKTIHLSVSRQSASTSQSFQCCQCVLVFKSKPTLLEHQSEVHGLNIDSSPEVSGSPTSNPSVGNDNTSGLFACRHCPFTTTVRSHSIKHKKKYHGNAHRKAMAQHPQMRYLNGKLLGVKTSGSKKSLDTGKKMKMTATVKDKASLQCKQLAGAKVSSPLFKSTSKTKPIGDSQKDLKTYKRASSGSMIKYLVPKTGSNISSSAVNVKSNDLQAEPSLASTTLILHSSPFGKSKDGVFQVTATSRNDLVNKRNPKFSLLDSSLTNDDTCNKKGTFSIKAVKRAHDEASQNHPVKKARVDMEQSGGLGDRSAEGNLHNGSNFTFEVSEDEEAQDVLGCELEEMSPSGNENAGSSKIYCCKHCSYSHKNIRGMSTHYQRVHPYIKYTYEYIGDADDWSATFRCLECPVEFFTVNDLKKHYGENHPDAPNVFTSTEHNLDLVFRCFVCPFTTSTSKLLKEHYKVKHPMHTEKDMLLYCKYTNRSQAESFQLGTSKKKSPTPTKKDETTVPEQSPVSKEVADELYHCKICTFSNKSVVAMLVHYQKKHPKTGVTIEKIKQSAVSTTKKIHKVPLVSLSSIPVELMEKSLSPQNKSSDVLTETKVKPETSQERPFSMSSKKSLVTLEVSTNKVGDISENKGVDASHNSPSTFGVGPEDIDSLFFCQFCNYSHQTVWGITNHQKSRHGIVKRNTEAIHIHTAEVRSKGRSKGEMSPVQGVDKKSIGMDSSFTTQEEDMYFCQFCNYHNSSVKSVLSHQNAKHGGLVSSDGILMYTAEVREDKLQGKFKASASVPSSNCNPSSPVEVDGQKDESFHKQTTLPHRSTSVSNPYEQAEDLFFCQQCNFGHVTVKGVLNHHAIRHSKLKITGEQISKYTEVMRRQIKKSKLEGKNLPHFPTGLPLPLIHDVGLFFCNLCNFSQSLIQRVVEHYRKRHPGLDVTESQISTYSSMVYEKMPKSNRVVPQEQGVQVTATVQSEKAQGNVQRNSFVSSSHYKNAMKTRLLKCRKCPYAAPHVYLLRRHLGNKHKMRLTTTEVLEMAFKDGYLKAGYHCQWCTYSHTEAKNVYKHCKKSHGDRGASLEYISTRLYVGPKTPLPKKKKSLLKSKDVNPSQRAEGNEEKMYACRACPFRSASLVGITNHYRAVHPWSVKEDGSVLGIIRRKAPNESRQKHETQSPTSKLCDRSLVQGKSEIAGVSSPPKKTSKKFHTCHLCFALFNNQHGLHTHYGKKHPDFHYDVNNSTAKQEMERPTNKIIGKMQVFKCPRCTYVNTNQHGILTHCQMKHPTLTARANKLLTGEAHFAECLRQRQPNEKIRFGGYMCKICPLTCVSFKKLKSHYAKDHKQTACNVLKPAPKQATVIKKQLLSKYLSTQGSILPTAFLKNKKSAAMKCHFCKYVCSTTHGLKRHMHIHHKDKSEAESQDCMHNCSLCSYTSSHQRYLAKHYTRTHGKAAFLTYYVPVYKELGQKLEQKAKSAVITHKTVSHEAKKSTAARKTCSLCSFQSFSEEDMAAHHAAEHPEVQSKTQQSHGQSVVYKCCLCHYSTLILKYLASHYKRTHSRDAFNAYFSLAKKQKQLKDSVEVNKLFKTESENATRAQCKKCPKLFFNSRLLLCIHYTHFHCNDIKMDFMVHSSSTKDLENYKCSHCNKEIKGTKHLYSHLLRHNEMYRKKASTVTGLQKPNSSGKWQATKPNKFKKLEKLTEVETIQDLAKLNVTRVEVFTLAVTPPASPPKSPERAEPQMELGGAKDHTCGQCGRSFMSAMGLLVHKRSHAAMAALQRFETLPIYSSKEMLNKYVSYRTGTIKPYHCGLCSYRSNVMGLLWSHVVKKHGDECPDIVASSSETVDQSKEPNAEEEPLCSSNHQEGSHQAEPPDESALTQKPVYSEHPDVQRQLNHYKLMMVQANASQETKPAEDGLLHCEFCNFSSGHLSSIRRHYLNRHNGKKLLRCKDCSFFTGLRKTLEVHMETGHSHLQSLPTHQKLLRCPLCLYQTKNKNSMIDHIVLHREERTMPIEVRRPKLSRYLQGIVFRCHKCTFTSASDENLRSHLLKHDDVKPYKCRLCYFDCTQLSQLEAHLCDKHQVVRNHELVGQINLDQLEAKGGTVSKEDEDMDTNIQNEKHEEELENMEKPSGILHVNQQKLEGDTLIENNKENIAQQNIAEQVEDERLNANTENAHKMETTESQDTKRINRSEINHKEDQVQRDELQQNEERDLGEKQAVAKHRPGEKSTAGLSGVFQQGQETAELNDASQQGQETAELNDASQRGQETAELNDASQRGQETVELNDASQRGQETAEPSDSSQRGQETAELSDASQRGQEMAGLSDASQRGQETAELGDASQRSQEMAELSDASQRGQEMAGLSDASQGGQETAELSDASQRGQEAAKLSDASQRGQEKAELSDASQRGQETAELSDASQRGQETAELSDVSQRGQEAAELSDASQRGQEKAELSDAAKRGQETAGKSIAGLTVATTAPFSQQYQKHTHGATVAIVAQQNTDTTVKGATQPNGDGGMASLCKAQDDHEVKTELTQQTEKDNHESPKNIKTQVSSIAEQQGLTDEDCDQNKILPEYQGTESTDVSFMNCEEYQVHREHKDELVDHYAEMPVLEKECDSEDRHVSGTVRCAPEENYLSSEMADEDEGDTPYDVKGQVQDGVYERIHEENSSGIQEHKGVKMIKKTHLSTAPHDAFCIGEVTGDLFPMSSKKKSFACRYCGRVFLDSTELKQHVIRHGM